MSLDRQALETLLAQLVGIPSLSGEEQALAVFCREWFEGQGLAVQELERSLIVRVSGGPGPRLLLNTHYDTVPPAAAWQGDPWNTRWVEGRLVGLGANDAKASVAAMMTATAELARGPRLAGELILSLHQEEETNNRGMELVRRELGKVDFAITGEPTGLEVIRAQSGLAIYEVRWTGKACHAAHVASVEHENALLSAAAQLARWPAPCILEGEHELLGPSTLSPTVMSAGQGHNAIPDSALVVFDARLAPPHDAQECLELLQKAFPGAEVHIRSQRLGPVDTPAQHPLVQAALGAAGRERAKGSNTLSDMALLPTTPAIKCGPGQTVRSHTAQEFILGSELVAGVEFYRSVIQALLQPCPCPSSA